MIMMVGVSIKALDKHAQAGALRELSEEKMHEQIVGFLAFLALLSGIKPLTSFEGVAVRGLAG